MKKLLLCLALLSFIPQLGSAKTSRSATKKQYNFVYERTWYHSLSSQQQATYLKTMDQLAYELATGRNYAAMDVRSIMDLFVPPAFAAGLPFNNGYNYTGSRSFGEFISGVDMGSFEPNCPSGESPCAAYTGLVKNSAGETKLACSPNSTPTCVRRGSQDLLQKAQQNCGGSNPSKACLEITKLMELGTKGVKDMCSSRRNSGFCDDAMTALAGDDIPNSPVGSATPSGRDCDSASNDMIQAHQNSRSGAAKNAAAYNNEFWTQISGFAQKACGRSSISSTMRTIGVCDVSNMNSAFGKRDEGAGKGQLTKSQVATHKKGTAGYEACVESKMAKAGADTNAYIYRISKDTSIKSEEERGKKRDEVFARYEKQKSRIKASTSCTYMEKVAAAAQQQLEISEIQGLSEKIGKNKDLTQEEENKFKAAIGMSSRQFSRTFCRSGNFKNFKDRLGQETRAEVKVQGTGQLSRVYSQMADAARVKMSRCASSLVSVEKSGCRFYNVEDQNLIRNATAGNPILIKNKKSNTCSLVTAYEHREVGSETKSNGTVVKVRDHVVKIKTSNSTIEKKMNPNKIFSENIVSVYRCKNDPVRKINYKRTDEDTAGEDAARGSESEI